MKNQFKTNKITIFLNRCPCKAPSFRNKSMLSAYKKGGTISSLERVDKPRQTKNFIFNKTPSPDSAMPTAAAKK